ncbi:hypothetical protein [Mycobacteroides abscessus]
MDADESYELPAKFLEPGVLTVDGQQVLSVTRLGGDVLASVYTPRPDDPDADGENRSRSHTRQYAENELVELISHPDITKDLSVLAAALDDQSWHWVESTVLVPVRLDKTGRTWTVDPIDVGDQKALRIGDDPNNNECDCNSPEICAGWLHRADKLPGPTGSQMLELLAKALGYSVIHASDGLCLYRPRKEGST